MDRTKLKNYAPKARREFIEAMTERAAFYGLTADKTEPVIEKGDVAVIGGRSFPIAVARKRKSLEDRIKRHGFQQTMEAMAYTWFNRLVAIRYMELHGYLDHGYRVLSHPDGKPTPEILEHAEHIDFPGLKKDRVIDLKLAGNKEGELYRLLLTAQCNALQSAMPFLFERIDDETEILLPDNLLNSDSLIRKLINEIDESDWQEVEIIGWLYQFYISEKKDQVIGKVVKSEDIPAATQLFTPNWIVKYMVQNSLGAQWLATYPQSPLKGQMEYYIEPAEQTDDVNAQLAAITPIHLNPEELTLIDPASGSGHILVESYDLFKAIYLERGYRKLDIPRLILEKNLFGLDIDERAAQLTSFALMMKGRADDRRLFERGVKLNVMALVDSVGFDAEGLAKGVELSDYGLKPGDVMELKRLFEHATTVGSLIQVPEQLAERLDGLKKLSEASSQDLFLSETLKHLNLLVQQAELLAAAYDAVVANPPYMGNNFHIPVLKSYLKKHYKGYEKDVFSAFIDRNLAYSKSRGRLGLMSPLVWMFISSHEHLRTRLIEKETLTSLVQLEYSGFEGATVPICTFTIQKGYVNWHKGCYIRLTDFAGSNNQAPKTLEAIQNRNCGWFFEAAQDGFKKIPGSPVAYWVSENLQRAFENCSQLGTIATTRKGMVTGDNGRFTRFWYEVGYEQIGFNCEDREQGKSSHKRWFPYIKGGGFRKWFGNVLDVVLWEDDGRVLRNGKHPSADRGVASNFNLEFIFKPNINWGTVTSSAFSARLSSGGELFDQAGNACFPGSGDTGHAISFLNSKVSAACLNALNPTLNFVPGDVADLPVVTLAKEDFDDASSKLVGFSRLDWDAYERSWNFQSLPILTSSAEPTPTLESSYTAWITQNRDTIAEMKRLEEENNRLFIDAYGLGEELTPEVPIEQITLTVNPAYRYGGKLTEEEQWTRFLQDTMEELVSYSIGCMMGRYSLDKPGLIYAHSGNQGFDPGQYKTFRADDDGIIPLLETDWGIRDDATHRFVEFVGVAWSTEHLEENLKFVAESLGSNNGEQAQETIRRYFATGFYKHHLSMYKKRPIYWLFSSGKLRAFQCLAYLHRYNEGTLARMRTEYVIPLQGQIAARIEQLEGDKAKATSTSHRNKIQKEQDKLKKQQVELASFEEKLKHYADMRISLDLDDGVKVNYAKFGDLLAESKAITGGKDDD
jgi:type II restriction/modification system DNA methylase subunit YeeA